MEDHLNPPAPRPPAPPRRRKGKKAKTWPDKWTRLNSAHPLSDFSPAAYEAMHKKFDFDKPDVCDYVAKIIFGCEMDYYGAAALLRPNISDVGEAIELVTELTNNVNLQAALTRLFKSIGIDDESRDRFVKQIWTWFYGSDKELALQASRILAKIFFRDDSKPEQPGELKIEGFDQGLQRLMGGGAAPAEVEEPIQTDALVMLEGKSE